MKREATIDPETAALLDRCASRQFEMSRGNDCGRKPHATVRRSEEEEEEDFQSRTLPLVCKKRVAWDLESKEKMKKNKATRGKERERSRKQIIFRLILSIILSSREKWISFKSPNLISATKRKKQGNANVCLHHGVNCLHVFHDALFENFESLVHHAEDAAVDNFLRQSGGLRIVAVRIAWSLRGMHSTLTRALSADQDISESGQCKRAQENFATDRWESCKKATVDFLTFGFQTSPSYWLQFYMQYIVQ